MGEIELYIDLKNVRCFPNVTFLKKVEKKNKLTKVEKRRVLKFPFLVHFLAYSILVASQKL